MINNIHNYIGYLTINFAQKAPEHGTCFFIDSTTLITADHVTNKEVIQKFTLGYNGIEHIIPTDKYKISYVNSCAIIKLYDEAILGHLEPLSRINTSFHIDEYQALKWHIQGYQSFGSGSQKTHIDGRICDISNSKFDYICSDVVIEQSTYEGMSGSPVIINDAVVGILQAQDRINNISKNLYFTSIKNIESYLNKESILSDVYNNIPFEKIKYNETISLENYICRKIKNDSESDDFSFSDKSTLFEIIHNNPDFYILLGEAGLGKTYELQHLALSCQQESNAVYPIYKNLQNIYDGQLIDEYIPELNNYLNNGVPFCLILDGYDEITNEIFRDNKFPKILSQLVEHIKRKRTTDKTSIVISSRKNFFERNKFDSFKSLEICPLSNEDIKNEVNNHNIDYAEFSRQIKSKGLTSFLKNPFYLKYIIEIYTEDTSLPEKNELMDSIITHLIVDKDKPKFKNTQGIKKLKTTALPSIEKISAAYLLYGKFSFSEDDFFTLIDENIDEANEELINCTNILDKDSGNNYYFKHNNFREYLSAKFLNKKYKDNLNGLLELITFKNKIRKNYLNMVSFLILIRETSDLTNWISKNCPEHFSLFESDKFDNAVKFTILKNAIDAANNKGYYATYDYQNDICNLVCSDECVNYLLDIINDSTEEIPLFNALRVLRDAKNTFGCEEKIKQVTIEFIDSAKGNDHHRRDAIVLLADLSVNSSDVTDFLYSKYANSNNKEIRRGLYRYILCNNLSDKFAEFLVNGLSIKSNTELTNYTLIDALQNIKTKNSFIILFNYLLNLERNDYTTDTFINEICNTSFINNLSMAYSSDLDNDFLKLVIDISCFFAKKFHKKENVFSNFFTTTNTENIAIEAYFNKYSDNPTIFQYLSNKFSIYLEFLKEGYKTKKFLDNDNFLFNFCTRSFSEDSEERICLLELIRDCNYPDCETSIQYITYSDNCSEKESYKLKLMVEYIFDYYKLKNDAINLTKTLGETNVTLRKLWRQFHNNYNYLDSENAILDTLNVHMKFKETTESLFNDIESNEFNMDFWILRGASNFIENDDKHIYLFNEDQLHVIDSLCRKYIDKYNPEEDIEYTNNGYTCKHYVITFVLHLIAKLDISLEESVLCKLLFIHNHLFKDSSKDGFPDYIIRHLPREKIINQIYYFIDKKLANNILGDECILYCTNQNIRSDKVAQLAKCNLLSENNRGFTFYSWDYLIKTENTNLIIELVKERRINEKDFIEHISLLTDYKDNKDLITYASEIFDSLYSYYLEKEITFDIYEQLKTQHPYITREAYEYIEDDKLKTSIKHYLKFLSGYLIKNGSDKHINIYLNDMIETKTYSLLENDTYDTLLSSISSNKFVDQLIILINMIYYNDFRTSSFTTIYSDIEKALINIGYQNINDVVEKLSPYKSDQNEGMRRFANKVIDNLLQYENEKTHQHYTIDELKEIVFN